MFIQTSDLQQNDTQSLIQKSPSSPPNPTQASSKQPDKKPRHFYLATEQNSTIPQLAPAHSPAAQLLDNTSPSLSNKKAKTISNSNEQIDNETKMFRFQPLASHQTL
jgi:hypothetical protein